MFLLPSPSCLRRPDSHVILRLLEFAGNYFDLASFPEGETKRALGRIINKLTGKGIKRVDSAADDKREKKKRKKN